MKHYFFILFIFFSPLISYSQLSIKKANEDALIDAEKLGITKDIRRNIYIDNDEVIHIFLFQDGNSLLTGFPTTATEKNKFQFHLYV